MSEAVDELATEYPLRLTLEEIVLLSRTLKWAESELSRRPGHETCGVPILELALKTLRQAQAHEQGELDRKAAEKDFHRGGPTGGPKMGV